MDHDTADRRDFSVFRVTAWTTRPELILKDATLVVPEPSDAEDVFRSCRRTLEYPIKIIVRRLLVCLLPDSPPPAPRETPPPLDHESPENAQKKHRRRHDRFWSDRASDSEHKDSTPPGSPAANAANAIFELDLSAPIHSSLEPVAVEHGPATAVRQTVEDREEAWSTLSAEPDAITTGPLQRSPQNPPDPAVTVQCIEVLADTLQPSAQRSSARAFDAAASLLPAFISEAAREGSPIDF